MPRPPFGKRPNPRLSSAPDGRVGPLERLARRFFARGTRPGGVGGKGEQRAEQTLRMAGMRILDRNWHTPAVGKGAELDLIADDRGTLVFVEVKTRVGGLADPEEQVDRGKQRRLARAARVYLARFETPPPVRFDIVAIVYPPEGGEPAIRHHRNAFSPKVG